MSSPLFPAIAALVLFQIKHFLCDFVLQTTTQVRTKGIYGHFGGISHAGLHALTSLPALLVLTFSPAAIAAIMVIEFVVHYHLDWSKARIDAKAGFTDQDPQYWVVFGLDQFFHQLTYIAFVFALAG